MADCRRAHKKELPMVKHPLISIRSPVSLRGGTAQLSCLESDALNTTPFTTWQVAETTFNRKKADKPPTHQGRA
jgi:hypothetical protein